MFVKANDCAIVNTDHIVWVDVDGDKMTVKLSDGTEHSVDAEKMQKAFGIINKGAEMASIAK